MAQLPKWKYQKDGVNSIYFEIEHDPLVGYMFYVYENGKCTKDYLQFTFDAATAQALEEYQVPLNGWKKIG